MEQVFIISGEVKANISCDFCTFKIKVGNCFYFSEKII